MKLINCCEQFQHAINEGVIDIYGGNVVKNCIAAIYDDSGHGGVYPIQFCPFCGTEIKEYKEPAVPIILPENHSRK